MPGNTLNEEVAVEVMGKVPYCYLVINGTRYDGPWFREPGIDPDNPPPGTDAMCSCSYYDADMNQAWRVVEKMKQRNYAMQINSTGSGKWHVTFKAKFPTKPRQDMATVRDNPAEAICVAALAALRADHA